MISPDMPIMSKYIQSDARNMEFRLTSVFMREPRVWKALGKFPYWAFWYCVYQILISDGKSSWQEWYTLNTSAIFFSTALARVRISARSLVRCGISFSPSAGRRYVRRRRKGFLSMSWKAWENSKSVTDTGIRTWAYLVLRDNEFDNIIKQTICGKRRWLGLTAYDCIQCALLRATITQELNRKGFLHIRHLDFRGGWPLSFADRALYRSCRGWS
jgi:hypothetical protein